VTDRKLQALRNLAERPGTEAEGVLAREILERLEAKQTPEEHVWSKFRDFLRSGNLEGLAAATGGGDTVCDCGNRHPRLTLCVRLDLHTIVAQEIQDRFQRGARVYYNYWAYPANCPATVTGYSASSFCSIRLKFDHLKNPRSVRIYRAGRWHLFTQPLDEETLQQTGLRGGMENIEVVE